MSEYETWLKSILPPSAKILELKNSNNRPAILLADLDGDRVKELVVAYQNKGQNYLLLFKKSIDDWYPVIEIKGKGNAITDLMVVPLTNRGVNTLIVGWQLGSMLSQLVLIQWQIHGFINLLTNYVEYSKLYAEDMHGRYGKDGQFELAIWIHDMGEAYIVDVYRYNGKGLMKANDHYPNYFKKVIAYYKQLLMRANLPDYWYYLADAQLKVKEFDQALISINKALSLTNGNPSKEKMIALKNEILNNRKQNET
ncbi:hypothetical protein [Rummeliibacillus pycnus]|uniref:hypothetical protein n=1 Tax=Rummeliibacillus pycnus TaxID=101070 RepID=UPI003D2AAF2E